MLLCSAGAPCVQENKAALAVTMCENNAEAVKSSTWKLINGRLGLDFLLL